MVVPLLREDVRLPPLARGRHPKRRILGQPLGVVGILVARQAVVDRLAEEVRQRELAIVSGARIHAVPLDQGVKAETFVQLAREQQPSIGGDRSGAELDAKLGIEREAKRTRRCVIHPSTRGLARLAADRDSTGPRRDCHARDELDDSAEPALCSDRRQEIRQHAEEYLKAVEGGHAPRDNSNQGVDGIDLWFQDAREHDVYPPVLPISVVWGESRFPASTPLM